MNTKTITITLSGARPDGFEMVKDSVVKMTLAAGPVAGSNTVTAASITDESSGLTIGSASISSPNATIQVTASNTGRFPVTASVTLSSGEIFKALLELKVFEAEPASSGYDYCECD